jgi:hypothetical protein
VATPRPLPDALAGRSYSLKTPGTLFSDLALRWPLNLKWYGLSVQNGSKRFYFLWLHLATPGFTGGSVRGLALLTPGTLFSDLALRWPLNLKWYGLSVQNGSKRFYFLWLHLATPGFTGGSVRGLALLTPGWGTVCDFSGRSSAGALTNELQLFGPVFYRRFDELRLASRSSTGIQRTTCDFRAGLPPAFGRTN